MSAARVGDKRILVNNATENNNRTKLHLGPVHSAISFFNRDSPEKYQLADLNLFGLLLALPLLDDALLQLLGRGGLLLWLRGGRLGGGGCHDGRGGGCRSHERIRVSPTKCITSVVRVVPIGISSPPKRRAPSPNGEAAVIKPMVKATPARVPGRTTPK